MDRRFRLAEGLKRFLLYDKQALRESNLKEEFRRIGHEEGQMERDSAIQKMGKAGLPI